MKTYLLFPPPASPTYVPYGAALLMGGVSKASPGVEVKFQDLNALAWRSLSTGLTGADGFWRFIGGYQEAFTSQPAYECQRKFMTLLQSLMDRATVTARSVTEGAEIPGWFENFLDGLLIPVLSEKPEAVCFSALYLDQVPMSLALADRALKLSGWKPGQGSRPFEIHFGGSALSACDTIALAKAFPFVDGFHAGEGERRFSSIVSGEAWVSSLKSESPRQSISAQADFTGFPFGSYANPRPVLPISMSRNCQWGRCRFCAHNFSFGPYAGREVSEVCDEMETGISRHGARHFYFVDQYVPAPRLAALSKEIIRRGIRVAFHVMARPTPDYDASLLFRAAEAGCRWISWGVESGSQRLLNLCCKGTRASDFSRILEGSTAAGISNLLMMLFGLPTSTDADLEETFVFLERVYSLIGAMTASSFILFDKTPFAASPELYGLFPGNRQILLRRSGIDVTTTRLDYKMVGEGGDPVMPRGPLEVSAWARRRRWLGEVPFVETLPCEHYLLFASAHDASPVGSPALPAGGRPRPVEIA